MHEFVEELLTDHRQMSMWCMPSSSGGLDSTSLSYSGPDPGRGDSSNEKHISVFMEVEHLFFVDVMTLKLLRTRFILRKIKKIKIFC